MVHIIKVDGTDHYFIDELCQRYDRYHEGLNFVTKLDTGELRVESGQITHQYGGQIYFHYCNNKYIIDDGYQDVLIRAGYIVGDKYDKIQIDDKAEGIKLRSGFYNDIKNVIHGSDIRSKYNDIKVDYVSRVEARFSFEKYGHRFTVMITTVSNLVTKNQMRRANNLPFYPFDKNVDKYGTMFMGIFAEKIDKDVVPMKKYDVADEFAGYFTSKLNNVKDPACDQYHYYALYINKRIIRANDL